MALGVDGQGIGDQHMGAHDEDGFGDDHRSRCSLLVLASDVVVSRPDDPVDGPYTSVRASDDQVGRPPHPCFGFRDLSRGQKQLSGAFGQLIRFRTQLIRVRSLSTRSSGASTRIL